MCVEVVIRVTQMGKVMSDGSTFAMTLSNVVYHSTTLMISYLYVHT